ncbi:MAG: hypothetical protein QOD74_19 [Variibacter sp.]|nr:hypothetical protein [Variibacter sp.]
MNQREDEELQERIRTRAYHMWEQEGRPEGRADAHWDMAAELTAIEDNQRLARKRILQPDETGPTGEPIEPLLSAENMGDLPTLTDQGEERVFPARQQIPAVAPIDTDAEAARSNSKRATGSARGSSATKAAPARAARTTATSERAR